MAECSIESCGASGSGGSSTPSSGGPSTPSSGGSSTPVEKRVGWLVGQV